MIILPGSKSLSARAIVANALAGNRTEIENIAVCDDADRLAAAFAAIAAEPKTDIYIGAGAAPLRFFLAAAASMPGVECLIECHEQLARRPMDGLLTPLAQLGADVVCQRPGRFAVRGKRIKGGTVSVDTSISSQFVSALMLAAPTWENGARILTGGKKSVSTPYIEMTAKAMRSFGAAVSTDAESITVAPGGYNPPPLFKVEPDWSAASYIYEMVALSAISPALPPSASILALVPPELSAQGDSACARLFSRFVATTFSATGANLEAKTVIDRDFYSADMTDYPDIVPALAATLCALGIPFRLSGIAHLRVKESNRIEALRSQLSACGYHIHAGDDYLESDAAIARFPAREITIDTFGDHRMAMSMAPLRHILPAGLAIDRPEVVEKSFPTYWKLFS